MMHLPQLKILHLLSQRPDSTGSGIFIQAMMQEAAALGHENFLIAGISSHDSGLIDGIVEKRALFVKFDGADVDFPIPGMSDVMPYESSRFADLSQENLDNYETAFSQRLQSAVDQFMPNIIHSHHLWIVSSLARRLYPHIPMVTTCHGSDLRQFQNCPHLRDRVLSGCRHIDFVMALSKAQKDEIIRLYNLAPEKILIVGAGYNDRLFYSDTKPEPNPVQLMYAGKLSNAKGVPWFLRALKTIRSPSWQLHLLGGGSGNEKARCHLLAKELGKKVHIYGAVPQKRLAQIMRRAHILILPSFFEGLPLVILEGLACGCRIVTTDLPGTKELLGGSDIEFITWIKTPRLRLTDQPYREDVLAFEQDLKNALRQQITAASKRPQIDLSPIQDKLDAYGWAGIFNKVRQAYRAALEFS